MYKNVKSQNENINIGKFNQNKKRKKLLKRIKIVSKPFLIKKFTLMKKVYIFKKISC